MLRFGFVEPVERLVEIGQRDGRFDQVRLQTTRQKEFLLRFIDVTARYEREAKIETCRRMIRRTLHRFAMCRFGFVPPLGGIQGMRDVHVRSRVIGSDLRSGAVQPKRRFDLAAVFERLALLDQSVGFAPGRSDVGAC